MYAKIGRYHMKHFINTRFLYIFISSIGTFTMYHFPSEGRVSFCNDNDIIWSDGSLPNTE